MKSFIYYTDQFSTARGFNQTVTVYQLRGHDEPIFMGIDNKINTASSKGPHAAACAIISERCGHKLTPGRGHRGRGYGLVSKSIHVYGI